MARSSIPPGSFLQLNTIQTPKGAGPTNRSRCGGVGPSHKPLPVGNEDRRPTQIPSGSAISRRLGRQVQQGRHRGGPSQATSEGHLVNQGVGAENGVDELHGCRARGGGHRKGIMPASPEREGGRMAPHGPRRHRHRHRRRTGSGFEAVRHCKEGNCGKLCRRSKRWSARHQMPGQSTSPWHLGRAGLDGPS